MRCEDVQRRLHAARYAPQPDPDLAGHLESCPDCAAVARRGRALDQVLGLDEPAEPRPGFDTRFFARLQAERERQTRPVWLGWRTALGVGATGAAAAAVLVLALGRAPEALLERGLGDPELAGSLGLVMELELLEDLELVRDLDTIEGYGEAYELLARVDVQELDALLGDSSVGVPQ